VLLDAPAVPMNASTDESVRLKGFGPARFAAQAGAERWEIAAPNASVPLTGGTWGIRAMGKKANWGFRVLNTSEIGATLRQDGATFVLHVPPADNYDLEAGYPETLVVMLFPQWFARCLPAQTFDVGSIEVFPQERAPTTAQTVATVMTGMITGFGALGGATAASDAQSMAVVGMVGCARQSGQDTTANYRSVSPAALDSTPMGMFFGNLILFVGVALLHRIVVGIFAKVKDVTVVEASQTLRYPTTEYKLLQLLYQGFGLAAVQMVTNPFANRAHFPLGLIGGLACLAVPLYYIWSARFHVVAGFYLYRTPPGPRGWARTLLLPRGIWLPPEMRWRYGPLFAWSGRQSTGWIVLPFVNPIVTVSAGLATGESASQCQTMFAVLAGTQFVIFAVHVLAQPLRGFLHNVFAGSASLLLGLYLVHMALAATNPAQLRSKLGENVMYAQMALVVVRLFYLGLLQLRESQWMDEFRDPEPYFTWSPREFVMHDPDAEENDDRKNSTAGGGLLTLNAALLSDLEHVAREAAEEAQQGDKRGGGGTDDDDDPLAEFFGPTQEIAAPVDYGDGDDDFEMDEIHVPTRPPDEADDLNAHYHWGGAGVGGHTAKSGQGAVLFGAIDAMLNSGMAAAAPDPLAFLGDFADESAPLMEKTRLRREKPAVDDPLDLL